MQAGAIFIDGEAKRYLTQTLRNAGLADEDIEEYVSRGVKDFESNAKRAFRDITVDQSIEVAGTRFNNAAIRTRRGRMNISGYVYNSFQAGIALMTLFRLAGRPTIKTFFDFCLSQILSSVESQLESTPASVRKRQEPPVTVMLIIGVTSTYYLLEALGKVYFFANSSRQDLSRRDAR